MSSPKETSPSPVSGDDATQSQKVKSMLQPSLYRLTAGLPRRELKHIIEEATACEAALEKEIEALESDTNKAAVDVMLSTELTSADRYYTVSALLGRLREPLATPHPPNSTLPPEVQKQRITTNPAMEEKQQALLDMEKHPQYYAKQDAIAPILACWKKISSHRTAGVFRRPVNTREAPGYTDRIKFPLDLSLIRKMITSSMIRSFAELHQKIGLICHNCVKYNGRESDYGMVAREFEAHADDCILAALKNSRTTTPTAEASKQTKADDKASSDKKKS